MAGRDDDAVPDDRVEELLGVYALDAVDDVDRRRVEAYLRANPKARAEVRELRDAAAMLSYPGGPAPTGVWDRIAASLQEQPPALVPPVPPVPLAPPVAAPHRRFSAALLGAAAALVVAVAGLVAVRVIDDDGGMGGTATGVIEEAYGAAWSDPDGRQVLLASEDGTLAADAVLGADGIGYLSARALPELPATETYQLWGVYADGDVISLGVVGNRPDIEPFVAQGDVEALVITREAAGGVGQSTSGALLVGELG